MEENEQINTDQGVHLNEAMRDREMKTPSPSIYLNKLIEKCAEREDKIEEYTQMDVEGNKFKESGKRDREDEDWHLVTKEKKPKLQDKNEVYVSSKDKLPKQFALAKLFKNLDILGITKIKYMNPYKIRVEFENAMSMEKMIYCKELIEKDWNFQTPFQVNYTYGTIRDVDIGLSDEDIVKNIKCDSRAILYSANRLNRRDSDGKWIPSETVRLCFLGSFLPPCVSVDKLRIQVDPYVFPVSQCSKCWKLSHTQSRCPSNKTICPKCGDKHANCDTKVFVCVNCQGDHMALDKSSCPEFLKEKRIREIMSEFNCTYRRARTMFVAQSPRKVPTPIIHKTEHTIEGNNTFSPLFNFTNNEEEQVRPTYATVLKVQADVHASSRSTKSGDNVAKKRRNNSSNRVNPSLKPNFSKSTTYDEEPEPSEESEPPKPTKEVTFEELLSRLKEILFMKGYTMQEKIKLMIKCGLEWLILVIVENIADWPILRFILDYING